MLAVYSEERHKHTDARNTGNVGASASRKIEVNVDHSEPGWMAVSFEKDGQVFAGMLLQANSDGNMPAFINNAQLADWKTRLAREKVAETVAVDEGTSMAADRTTTTLDRSRIRSVRLRPTIGRFICAKCRTPAGSVAEQASKRKSELLASPVRTGLIAKKPKLDVRRKSPQMTPIVEMRTANGFIFRPVRMNQKHQPHQQQSAVNSLRKVMVQSSTVAPNVVQKMLVRRPIVNLGTPVSVPSGYRQQAGIETTTTTQSPVPKIRIVMPNRGNASTPIVATTTTPSPVTSTVCATGTAVIKTGAPIMSPSLTTMSSSVAPPRPLPNGPITPPIRIKLGGLNFRQLVCTSAPQAGSSTSTSTQSQVIRIRPVPSSSSSSPTAHVTPPVKPRVVPQIRRVIDTNLEPEDTPEPVEAVEPSPEQNPEGLRTGEVVWAKMPGEPFWPAQIYSFNPGGEACVLWLGSTLHGFVAIRTLEPFAKCFAKRYNAKRTERGYQKAVVDAIVKNQEKSSDTAYYEQKLSSSAWKLLTGKQPDKSATPRRTRKAKKRKILVKTAAGAGAGAVVQSDSVPIPSGRRAKAVPQHIRPQSAEVSSTGVDEPAMDLTQLTSEDDKQVEEEEEEDRGISPSCSQPDSADGGDASVTSEAPVLQSVEAEAEASVDQQQLDEEQDEHRLPSADVGIELLESDDDETADNRSVASDTLDTVISELQEMNEMCV